jgi:AcrR family transcriptional regulator
VTDVTTDIAPATAAAVAHGGRPRDPDISRAILDATIDLLATDGYATLSITDVAQRAGVHKPAVYRRWKSKLELAVAAITELAPHARDPQTDSVATDLVQILLESAPRDDAPGLATMLRLKAAIRDVPELTDAVDTCVVGPRRAVVHAALRRGIERGEVRADVDIELASDLLFGVLQARSTSGRAPLTRKEAVGVVTLLLQGVGVRG